MSYQGKKNIPRITVSLVLGKSAVGPQPFVARNIQGIFLKEGEEVGPNFSFLLVAEEGDCGGRRNRIEL